MKDLQNWFQEVDIGNLWRTLRAKISLSRLLLCLVLGLALTTLLYWPVISFVPLNDFQGEDLNNTVSSLDNSLNERFKVILEAIAYLPFDRHELCLLNRNSFYYLHSDSYTQGIPFAFHTDNLSVTEYGQKNKLGTMTIKIFYNNGIVFDENYREYGQPMDCITLNAKKLDSFASSTIEYQHGILAQVINVDTGDGKTISLLKSVIKGYSIDTHKSVAIIVARWHYALLTLLAISSAFYWLIGRIFPARQKKESLVIPAINDPD
jgi:hypothetical protein